MVDGMDRMIEMERLSLHIRDWQPAEIDPNKPVYVLLHGLSSNAHTWDLAAPKLVDAGFRAVAVDQRGHGLSDKPDSGYDFETVTDDLKSLLEVLELENVILAGQSWGGNVVLNFGARFPQAARALVFVDGGFLNLAGRGTWEEVSRELRPPDLLGIPRDHISARIAQMHPHWTPEGVEATLHNFETLPDGTIRPWLTLERHIAILRALFEQDASELFSQVRVPVLICAADDGSEWANQKRPLVEAAERGIPQAKVAWFEDTAHDIHVDRPGLLAEKMLGFVRELAVG